MVWGCINHNVTHKNHKILHAQCSTLIKPIFESNFHLHILNIILGNWRWARVKKRNDVKVQKFTWPKTESEIPYNQEGRAKG